MSVRAQMHCWVDDVVSLKRRRSLMFFMRLRFVCSCFSLDTILDESNCDWRCLWRIILYKLFATSGKRNVICNLQIREFCSCIRGLVVEFVYLFEWCYMPVRTCVLIN